MSAFLLVCIYILIGCACASRRIADIAADATDDDVVPVMARWVLTWPIWARP